MLNLAPFPRQPSRNVNTRHLTEPAKTVDNSTLEKNAGGILIQAGNLSDSQNAKKLFIEKAKRLGIANLIKSSTESDDNHVHFHLINTTSNILSETYNTLQLCETYNLSPRENPADLEIEIILAMLTGPVKFIFPSHEEFLSSVRTRCNIVEAARRTALAFHTSKIERPEDYWSYSEDTGFIIKQGKSLIDGLRAASQPEETGNRYAFSCYRATEYVILLGIAQELAVSNTALLQKLQKQWETKAIMSRQFHEVFLQEFGSMNDPLPYNYYIPGDRLWFRNPDQVSGDIIGFEGSWVFYIGEGMFTNFWERDKPYTLTAKCIEIYHWRHGAYKDEHGQWQMNEEIVGEHVQETLKNPEKIKDILNLMFRLRDPQEICADGGCIDASREFPHWLCPDTSDLILPTM